MCIIRGDTSNKNIIIHSSTHTLYHVYAREQCVPHSKARRASIKKKHTREPQVEIQRKPKINTQVGHRDNTDHQRLPPGLRQGYWKVERDRRTGNREPKWVDILTREPNNIPVERLLFRDWLLPQEILDQREQIRNKYSKQEHRPEAYSLQKLCLIAISTSSNRTIDSIALEVQEDRLQIITNRIV
jgi:hypothetical protein